MEIDLESVIIHVAIKAVLRYCCQMKVPWDLPSEQAFIWIWQDL